MARKAKAEEVATMTGPYFLLFCQFSAERGTPLTVPEMKVLMDRMEKTAESCAGEGNGNGHAP